MMNDSVAMHSHVLRFEEIQRAIHTLLVNRPISRNNNLLSSHSASHFGEGAPRAPIDLLT